MRMTAAQARKMALAGNIAGAQSALKQAVGLPGKLTAADALRYTRQTGDQSGAQQILRGAVGLPTGAPPMGAPSAMPPPQSGPMGGMPQGGMAPPGGMSAMRKGGEAKSYAKGGVTRADGCARKGHTKGRMV